MICRGVGRSCLVWALLLGVGSALAPVRADGEPVPIRRHVIALMEGSAPDSHTEDVVHELLELPLNHYGLIVHRHYIQNGPPPARWLEDAHAILTYFTASGEPQPWLWPWLEDAAAGRRVLHFGEFGPLEKADPERLRRWLARFDLAYDDAYVGAAEDVNVVWRSEATCRYEADPRARATHRGPRNLSPKNKPWIRTTVGAERQDERTPVITGPWGGLALDPWPVRKGSDAQDRRWHIEPFLFVQEALGLERQIAPHPCVLNGRRMWILQVDGDGFESLSTIQRDQLAAKVMHEEIFLQYKLPYTVSIIVRSLTKDYNVVEPTPAMVMARKILNTPWIEAASHGVLHTLKWQVDLLPTHGPRTIMWYRSLKNYEYSQVNEVKDSIRFINERLLEKGKRCEVMLWTGYANPREDAILAAYDSGSVNLNGGVFRWDLWHDSVGYVTPWSRRAGRALQVYAGAANENDFEGFFTTMPGSFAHIDQTIARTGEPRILKPADIYIHFYSAESRERLRSVHDLIKKWAYEKPTAPVFCSTYSNAVRSAVNGSRIFRTRDGWELREFGRCRTARIDDEPKHVDFAKSTGLLGARRIGKSLYIHLAQSDAHVVLADDPARSPHVIEANCLLHQGSLGKNHVTFVAEAVQERMIAVGGWKPGETLRIAYGEQQRVTAADNRGVVTVRLPEGGRTRVRVSR